MIPPKQLAPTGYVSTEHDSPQAFRDRMEQYRRRILVTPPATKRNVTQIPRLQTHAAGAK